MTSAIRRRNHIVESGAGARPIVFAHGFGCDQNMWRFVAPAFEADHRVVRFDYVGCGKSDLGAYDPERYANLAGYARDVVEICDALDLRDAVFVGHSVSAMIGVLAANERPDRFGELVMVGPSPRYIDDPPDYVGGFERGAIEQLFDLMDRNYVGWATFLAPVIMKNADRPALAQELSDSFCSTDPVTARNFARATFFADNRADLAAVRVPSLIMQCRDDAVAPEPVGRYLHRRLANSTLAMMEATGHCPHVSHPEETVDVIRRYLAGRAAH